MGRYTGPKARINRRLSTMVYENGGPVRAMERRQAPPGMHTRPPRPTGYGAALNEKQKIKHHYGVMEKQLRRYFGLACKMKGNTGESLLLMCERRLDNVVRRAGFAATRPQARQGVAHGHFYVNGHKVSSPSYEVRAGDIIQVRARENLKNVYKSFLAASGAQPVDWLTVDSEGLQITVAGLPAASDISLPVDVNTVVEFLSR